MIYDPWLVLFLAATGFVAGFAVALLLLGGEHEQQ